DAREARAIAAARRGDPEGFDYLVATHARRVAGVAWTLTGSADLAEELAQEAFVRAFTSITNFREGEAFAPWILRIVTNLAIDAVRARGRLEPDHALAVVPARRDDEPDVRAASAEIGRRIEEALASLPLMQQMVARLFLVEEWDHGEIAAATGLPPATVRSHLSLARARLRERLGDLWRTP
ncbi:MAG TPA: sigma-70 family RNA polymerase sigma factor, partial [Thermoanaerobaculia bacterium]|nr:sigma-70 family RNA polymerase sigma factor [Thermoanaerobaculia bacterium]